jgi:hypothetical protein
MTNLTEFPQATLQEQIEFYSDLFVDSETDGVERAVVISSYLNSKRQSPELFILEIEDYINANHPNGLKPININLKPNLSEMRLDAKFKSKI